MSSFFILTLRDYATIGDPPENGGGDYSRAYCNGNNGNLTIPPLVVLFFVESGGGLAGLLY
jgi:hypothetical protein